MKNVDLIALAMVCMTLAGLMSMASQCSTTQWKYECEAKKQEVCK